MIMRGRILYILLVALWLLSSSHAAYAFTYGQASQPASWDRKPTLSDEVNTAYNFRSTSSYTPIVGTTSYMSDGSGPVSAPRRAKSGWGAPDDDDNPVGAVSNVPVGEPLILLLMALGYLLYVRSRTRRAE